MLKDLMRQVPFFSTLPDYELETLAENLREKIYPPETVLFEEGDTGDRFYIVLEGEVAILKARGTPNEQLLNYRGAGQIIGEMSLLNQDRLRTASAVTHTACKTLELARLDFDALLNRRPNLTFEMLRVLSARLSEANDRTIRDLTEKNLQLEEAYAELQAAQEQIIQKQLLERELAHAEEIQRSMLPRRLPQLEGYDIGATMTPARSVGGDLYDIIQLSDEKLGIVIGDVSGKGIPAALFMALTQSLIRATATADMPPAEVLTRVNRHLFEMNAGGMFVTVLYGVLCKASREFNYVRAAHEYPLVWDKNGHFVPIPKDHGLPLGLFSNPSFQTQTLQLPTVSTLVLYTDGVTEAMDANRDFFGQERLEATITSCLEDTAQGHCQHLVQHITTFHGDTPQDDDLTLIVIKTC